MSKLEIAKSLGLISESEYGGYRAKNFAVLMFAENPNKFIRNAHVEIIREIDGTDKMESKKFEGPVWIQAKQVSQYFKVNIQASYTIRKTDTIEHEIIYNYPLSAFEELATNAILHKEYDNSEYVGIYVYKDSISFLNHNRPLPPVTIESLNTEKRFDKRKYLNKELKEMFFALGLIESYGSGIRRAKEALKLNRSPELKFYPDNDIDDYTNAVMGISSEFLSNKDYVTTTKTTIMQQKILEIISENPNLSVKDIASILGLSVDGVRYHINKMKKLGLIEYKGSSKSGQWILIDNN